MFMGIITYLRVKRIIKLLEKKDVSIITSPAITGRL